MRLIEYWSLWLIPPVVVVETFLASAYLGNGGDHFLVVNTYEVDCCHK
jgi:hypothetical protein